jgi:hypothetical protein
MDKIITEIIKKWGVPKEQQNKIALKPLFVSKSECIEDGILIPIVDKYTNNNNTYLALYTTDGELYCDVSENNFSLPCDKIRLNHDIQEMENTKSIIEKMITQKLLKKSQDGSYFILADFFPIDVLL